jgi:hypothetical protein
MNVNDMTDEQLLAETKRVERALQTTPQSHPDRNALLRDFGRLCPEVNRRGLTGQTPAETGLAPCLSPKK